MIVLNFIVALLGDANFLIAIIVAFGIIVQKKSFSQVLSGAVKATIGLMVLNGGSTILMGPLNYLDPLMREAFGTTGLLANNESFLAVASTTFGSSISLILLGSFIVNVLIARFTKWKYINLVTHHGLFAGATMAVLFASFGVTNTLFVVVVSSIIAGFWSTFIPAYLNRYTEKVVAGQPIAIGHYCGMHYWISGFLGEHFGNAEHSCEHIEMPKGLSFLKENVLMTALIMALVFIVATFCVSKDFLVAQGMLSEDGFRVLFALTQGLTFGAGLSVLLQGVRMLLAEILPAFQGIASKIVPNAKPALDCPVVMPYAPNSTTIGFLVFFVSALITTLIIRAAGGILVIPSPISAFFVGGTAACFANAMGGRRGVVIASVVNGVIQQLFPLVLYQFTRSVEGLSSVAVCDSDFIIIGSLTGYVLKALQGLGLL